MPNLGIDHRRLQDEGEDFVHDHPLLRLDGLIHFRVMGQQ